MLQSIHSIEISCVRHLIDGNLERSSNDLVDEEHSGARVKLETYCSSRPRDSILAVVV